MFKFLKEWILDPIKEGMDEARQEMAEEKETAFTSAQEHLATVPYEEQFATALAAPFRVVVFGDWFTVFKDDGSNDKLYPVHLFAFGDGVDVTEENITDFRKMLERDFGITDGDSTLTKTGTLLRVGAIPCNTELPEEAEELFPGIDWELLRKVLNAVDSKNDFLTVLCAMTAYILTSATEVGYLKKEEAMPLLRDIGAFARTICDGWTEYGDAFLCGEKLVELNRFVGRKILGQYVGHLQNKPYSPWNRVGWHA